MIIVQQALMHQYDNNIHYKLFNDFEAENINI